MYAAAAGFGFERLQVAAGEIDNVDVVAYAGAVGRGVVAAEYRQFGQRAGSHAADIGQQVVGDAFGVFADAPAGVGADGVEIAQQHGAPARIGGGQIAQHGFDDVLGRAVGVGGGAGGHGFVDRHPRRIAVHGGRRAEHYRKHAGGGHFFKQNQAAADVVVVILERFLHALAHRFERGKVDHAVDLLLGKHAAQQGAVADVALIKRRVAAADFGDAFQNGRRGIAEVVEQDGVVAGGQQFDGGMRTDKAGGAGNQNIHGVLVCWDGLGF